MRRLVSLVSHGLSIRCHDSARGCRSRVSSSTFRSRLCFSGAAEQTLQVVNEWYNSLGLTTRAVRPWRRNEIAGGFDSGRAWLPADETEFGRASSSIRDSLEFIGDDVAFKLPLLPIR